jgi:hypothetical protein
VSISRRVVEPVTGAHWALRSWSAGIAGTPRLASAPDRKLTCFAAGVEERGHLVEPLPRRKRRMVGARDALCLAPRDGAAAPVPPSVRVFVDDADAPDPRPVRVVVAGLLGERTRSAELLGAGAPRVLALGRHGSYLLVLGPEYAGAHLRVRERRAHRVSRTSSAHDGGGWFAHCVPTPGLSVRVADPDGGPSWTAGRGHADGHNCRYVGRVIGDRVATVSDARNWIIFEPQEVSVSFTRRPRASNRPLTMSITDPRFVRPAGRPPDAAPSPAQVARRTLPGRMVLTGSASEQVTSITLRTPRDVRTVRPGPGGLFLAVYDGVFYDGQIHAVARMRDGSTITHTFPIGDP